MPLYRCLVPSRAVRMESRQAIARAITAAHCDATGAPAKFVHVFFFDLPESDNPTVLVNGSIRAGRTDEQKQRIVAGIQAAFEQLAGMPAARASVDLIDAHATGCMEGGRILPEPAEEAAWLAAGHE